MTDKPQVPARQSDESPSESLEAAAIAAYLEAHPDFFVQHEELLPALRIPHRRGDTVSLVERQMTILRDRNIELRHRLSHLMDVARDNDRLFDKTRRLILALMDAASLEDVVMSVEDSLRQDFQVPFVSLILLGDNAMPVGRWVTHAEAQVAIGGLLQEEKASAAACASTSWTSCSAKSSASRSVPPPSSPSATRASTASWPSPAVIRSTTKARWAPCS